jgi:hypothetical protein
MLFLAVPALLVLAWITESETVKCLAIFGAFCLAFYLLVLA